MARIAPQHTNDPWRPLLGWPDDCLVQWGRRGLVIRETGSYGTAFFEAFPNDGSGGFLRGEGATVEDAEADCFASWQRQHACHTTGGHHWTRARRLEPRGDGKDPRSRRGHVVRVTTYTNGGCFCLKCGAFQTVMPPVVTLGAWKEPLSASEMESIADGGCRPESWQNKDPGRWAKYRHRLALRAKMHGLALPDFNDTTYAIDPKADPFSDDAYQRACREAVVRYYAQQVQRLRTENDADGASAAGFFDGLSLTFFHRDAVRMGLLPAEPASDTSCDRDPK